MAPDTPRRPRGRPPGTRDGDSPWREYMYPDEAELYVRSMAAVEKAKSDMKGPLRIIGAIRTRCFGRMYRERERGEQS